MSDPATIFRPEALERHARGPVVTDGDVRLGRPWLTRLFWSALVLFAAGVAAMWLITIDETASGPALVDGSSGSVTVLLPAPVAAGLSGADRLQVQLPGTARPLAVVVQTARIADVDQARQAGFGSTSQAGVVVTGRLADGSGAGPEAGDHPVHAEGVLVLRSERLVEVVGRQVQTMLGPGTTNR